MPVYQIPCDDPFGKRQESSIKLFLRVQVIEKLPAPLILSTPFQNVPYQILGNTLERCRYFWGNPLKIVSKREIIKFFFLLGRKPPAFSYRIRGPPSEIWHSLQISQRRSAIWQIRNSTSLTLRENQ